jgi:drug/metabolite transporter (DMT)-like permease
VATGIGLIMDPVDEIGTPAVTVLLAIVAALSYGAADFLGGTATKRAGESLGIVAGSSLVGVGLLLLLVPVAPGAGASVADVAWGAGAGLAGGLGVVLFYRALAAGVMSVVAPVTAVISAIVPVVAGLALGEHPGAVALGGVALAVVAVALLSREAPGKAELRAVPTARVLPLAFIAGLGFGGFFVLLDRTGDHSGLWPLVASRTTTFALTVVIAAVFGRSLRFPAAVRRSVLGTGVLDMAANALFLVANREGLLALVAVIVSLYPASTIALAQFFLGERLARHQLVGVVIAAAAVVLIAAG